MTRGSCPRPQEPFGSRELMMMVDGLLAGADESL
jgi:hypothetical protein